MPKNVYVVDKSMGSLLEMESSSYFSESELQNLIANHPELLGSCIESPDDQARSLLLIKQEMGIPDAILNGERWSMDHFYIDSDCIPTLVEVKRSKDPRIRREVVGQMLDYAANAVVYWSVEKIKVRFFAQWGGNAAKKLDEFIKAAEIESAEEFWRRVDDNLRRRVIRMIFVADELPPELIRIIEFINEEMKNVEVLGLELSYFSGGEKKVIVPTLFGNTSRAESMKSAQRSSPHLGDLLAKVVDQFMKKFDENNILFGNRKEHYQQILLGDGNEVSKRIHYEFLQKGDLIRSEFHVETDRHKESCEEILKEVVGALEDCGNYAQEVSVKKNKIILTPKSQNPADIADSMVWLIQSTRGQLLERFPRNAN